MPLLALFLVLIAAVLHAFWNLLAKDARDSSAFMWWGVSVGATWYGLWMLTQTWMGLPREIWLVFAGSLAMEIAYVGLITRGYATGDLSQVYPIARGSPPLLIALFSAIFIGERLPLPGYVGIALLIVGVYLASLPSLDDLWKPLRALSHRPAQWALLAAFTVSIYSTLDKIAMNYATPLVYNAWVYAGISIGYAPVVWSRANRTSTFQEFKTNWRRIGIGSVATVGSYLLALTGMSMTAASYVGAVRATSVVIGALFGWLLLKESFGAVRVFAAAVMVIGLTLVAVA
ncbi:MAG: EamA family transporter [Chloroflexota bacterium]|nr:EamA family transporter [Chloroflexota bacterium]